MRCLTRSATLLALCLVLGPALAEDKKDDKKPAPSAASEYTSIGEVTGVLAGAPDEKANTVSLRLNQLSMQNGGGGYNMLRGKGAPKVKETQKDLPLEMTSDVKVRRLHLPPKTDEKGKKIPYTEKELKELKGETNLRGYEASLDDLHSGMVVTLHLVKMKADKADKADKAEQPKPHVNRIYIVTDNGPAGDSKDKKSDKK